MTIGKIYLEINRAQTAVAIAKNIAELNAANTRLTNALWQFSEYERNERLARQA